MKDSSSTHLPEDQPNKLRICFSSEFEMMHRWLSIVKSLDVNNIIYISPYFSPMIKHFHIWNFINRWKMYHVNEKTGINILLRKDHKKWFLSQHLLNSKGRKGWYNNQTQKEEWQKDPKKKFCHFFWFWNRSLPNTSQ